MLPGFRPRLDRRPASTPSSSARPRRCSPPMRSKRDDFTPRRDRPARAGRPVRARRRSRLGSAPPVIDGRDVLADPRGMLGALCAALEDFVRRSDARPGRRAGARATASGRPPGTTRSRNRPASRRRAARSDSTNCPTRSRRSPRPRARSTSAWRDISSRPCARCQRRSGGIDAPTRPRSPRFTNDLRGRHAARS